MEILLADNTPSNIARIESLLSAEGIQALSVDTLAAARDALRAVRFPLLILGPTFSDGDGIDLCREYSAQHARSRPRVLIACKGASSDATAYALAAGADDYLNLDQDDQALRAKIRHQFALSCSRALSSSKQPGLVDRDEVLRLNALARCEILDTPNEQIFDDIARLAAEVCKTPIALISLVDESRQWFKSRVGLEFCETPRSAAFCAHAIAAPEQLMIVPDTQADERFRDNPLVTGRPHLRFYAGAPLVTRDGHALGTLCVADRVPRSLDANSQALLSALARQVTKLLELRECKGELERAATVIRRADTDLRRGEALFRAAFDHSPTGRAFIALTGKWLRVNDAMCRMLGYSREQMLESSLQATAEAGDGAICMARMQDMIDGVANGHEFQARLTKAHGERFPALISISLVRDALEQPACFIADIRDTELWYGIKADLCLSAPKLDYAARISA